jgi:hypothetical protein
VLLSSHRLTNGALPSIDAAHAVHDVRGGREPVGDELTAQVFKPGTIRCRDDNFTQALYGSGHAAGYSDSRVR